MERLRFEAFLDTQSNAEKGEVIGFAKDYQSNLDKDNVDRYEGDVILSSIANR